MEVAIDNFVTFFVAGQETTANMLSFALLELGRHPDVLARLESCAWMFVHCRVISEITLSRASVHEENPVLLL